MASYSISRRTCVEIEVVVLVRTSQSIHTSGWLLLSECAITGVETTFFEKWCLAQAERIA